MKNVPLIILAVVVVVQLAVPFSMIGGKERILREGELFRFKTRPIDPADPFQGRYVRLGIQNDYVADDDQDLNHREHVYAFIESDENGFAYFSALSREIPDHDIYLKTRYVGYRNQWNNETGVSTKLGKRIEIPFSRFYMDEAKAPRAERIARDSMRTTNCWVNVRVFKGKAVIEDVFAEGQSLRDLAATER